MALGRCCWKGFTGVDMWSYSKGRRGEEAARVNSATRCRPGMGPRRGSEEGVPATCRESPYVINSDAANPTPGSGERGRQAGGGTGGLADELDLAEVDPGRGQHPVGRVAVDADVDRRPERRRDGV